MEKEKVKREEDKRRVGLVMKFSQTTREADPSVCGMGPRGVINDGFDFPTYLASPTDKNAQCPMGLPEPQIGTPWERREWLFWAPKEVGRVCLTPLSTYFLVVWS